MSTDLLDPPVPPAARRRGRPPKSVQPAAQETHAAAPPPTPDPSPVAFRRAAEQLRQIGDVTRLRILRTLHAGEQNVSGICAVLGLSQPAVSHHLILLRLAEIVEPERRGKNNVYHLTEKGRMLMAAAAVVMGA